MHHETTLGSRIQDIISLVTGVTVAAGIFRVSWSPPAAERKLLCNLLVSIEDRRILVQAETFGVMAAEKSVQQIRSDITDTVKALSDGSKAVQPRRAMRDAYLDFLNTCEQETEAEDSKGLANVLMASNQRQKVFGRKVAILSARYGIDLGRQLAHLVEKHGQLRRRGTSVGA